MGSDGNGTRSLWMDAPPSSYPPVQDDLTCDVCIVGAGMAGLAVAYELACEGTDVVVLDDGPIGRGETARSTAHLASALDDRFHALERRHGPEGARLAAASHAVAIDRIETIAKEEGIDCGFARCDGWLIRAADSPADELERELAAARRCGLPAELVPHTPFPGIAGPALRFPGQGRLDPQRWAEGLARAAVRRGARIATGTRADRIAAREVRTADGHRVRCRSAVVATNSPISDRVAMHTKLAAYRTYVVALRVQRGALPDALLWDTAEPYHYVRLAPGAGPEGDDLVLVGGEDHKTGQDPHPGGRWDALVRWARAHFAAGDVVAHWSGQIIEPVDGLAYIGPDPADRAEARPVEDHRIHMPALDPLVVAAEPMAELTGGGGGSLLREDAPAPTAAGSSPGTAGGAAIAEGVWLCTGDSGNGITHGAIAGLLLRDLVRGRHHPWEDLYAPSRKPVHALGHYARENLNVARQYAHWAGPAEAASAAEIAPGCGAVLRRGLQRIAAFRDAEGRLHECSAVCPHLGCVVGWNHAEGSWDCPCHGSRFAARGQPLNGPANRALTPASDRSEEDTP